MDYVAYFDLGDGEGERGPYPLRTASPDEYYCSESFKRAASQYRISMLPNAELLSAHAAWTGDTNVRILADGALVFKGLMAPTDSWVSNGIALDGSADISDFEFEVLDYSSWLDREITDDDNIAWENLGVCSAFAPLSIVHKLLALCGITYPLFIAAAHDETVLPAFAANSGELIGDVLDSLLHQYGLVLRWEIDHFETAPWLIENPIPSIDIDETIVLPGLKTERTGREADSVVVSWYALKEKAGCLLSKPYLAYKDTGQFDGYPVQAGLLWPEEANVEETWFTYEDTSIANTVSRDGSKISENKDFSQIVLTKNHSIDAKLDAGLVQAFDPIFKNKSARLAFRNPSAVSLNIYYCLIYGDVVYRGAENVVSKTTVSSPRTLTGYAAEHIHEETLATRLACALADQYKTGCWRSSFASESKLALGAIGTLSDPYAGFTGLVMVIKRSFDPATEIYSYRSISIAPVIIDPTANYIAVIPTAPKAPSDDSLLQAQRAKMDNYVYVNNIPPSSNASNLQFSAVANPNGGIDITIEFDCLQGDSHSDGFLFVMKRALTEPEVLDIALDTSVVIAACSSIHYKKTYTIPAKQLEVGPVPIHYRFGVIAFGNRQAGPIFHQDGIIESAEWIDKTFASSVMVDDDNFWNLDSGAFRVTTANGDQIDVDPTKGISIKAKLLQLEVDMSRLFSLVEFYKSRAIFDSPILGDSRIVIGDGRLSFDEFDTAWRRKASLVSRGSKLAIDGKMMAKINSDSFITKTRAQIAVATSWYGTGCELDATHIVGLWNDITNNRIYARVGTVSGDTISWGTAQSLSSGSSVGNLRCFFVTATKVLFTWQYEVGRDVLYTWGTYAAGVLTLSGVGKGIQQESGQLTGLWAFLEPAKVLGQMILGWSDGAAPHAGRLTRYVWDDAANTLVEGATYSTEGWFVQSGSLVEAVRCEDFGDYYLVEYHDPAGVMRQDLYIDDYGLVRVKADYFADTGVPGLIRVPGRIKADLLLLYSAETSKYYLHHASLPGSIAEITIAHQYQFIVPCDLSSRGVALEADYYFTPFTATSVAMVGVGAGIIEKGSDSNGDEYWVLGDGTQYYPNANHEFRASGTFVVPVGVTQIWLSGVGPGGNGGTGGPGGTGSGAGGGGGGGGPGAAIIRAKVAVMPGQVLTITINSTSTTVDTVPPLVLAKGGNGGTGVFGNPGSGGGGGSVGLGSTLNPRSTAVTGGNGDTGGTGAGGRGGGNPLGLASGGAGGPRTTSGPIAGSAATEPGCGGGGGSGGWSSGQPGGGGGLGAIGMLLIEWQKMPN